MAGNAALVLEMYFLVAGLACWHEAQVHKWLELNFGRGLEGVQVEHKGSVVAFAADDNLVVEVALSVALELHIQFDCEARSNVSDVFVVYAEV